MKSLAAALEWKENDVRTSVTRTRTFTGRLQRLDERWQRSFPITSRSYAYQGSPGVCRVNRPSTGAFLGSKRFKRSTGGTACTILSG